MSRKDILLWTLKFYKQEACTLLEHAIINSLSKQKNWLRKQIFSFQNILDP